MLSFECSKKGPITVIDRLTKMTNEDWVAKLLKLCEQKHGMNTPAMQQLRQQLDAIRLTQSVGVKQFAVGRTLAAAVR
jgi:hypothetical protein